MKVEPIEDQDVGLLIKMAQELIRIPTQNPPGNEKGCAEFVYRTLTGWGVKAEMVFEPYPHRPQVVAMVSGRESGRTLILNGHMDVVPEGSLSRWEDDPYGGTIKAGRIYGRGSSDMKGALAVMMVWAKLLHDRGFPGGKSCFSLPSVKRQENLGQRIFS